VTRGRHGCDAVLENGPAAPELRHRCASLHHGRGPAGPAEYKCVARVRVRHGELPSDREPGLTEPAPYKPAPAKAGVQQIIGADPFSGHMFIFRSKRGHYLKGLYWDGSGLCLFAKRLERGKFVWPPLVDGTMTLTPAQLALLIDHPQRYPYC
jgi:hypothetical protein